MTINLTTPRWLLVLLFYSGSLLKYIYASATYGYKIHYSTLTPCWMTYTRSLHDCYNLHLNIQLLLIWTNVNASTTWLSTELFYILLVEIHLRVYYMTNNFTSPHWLFLKDIYASTTWLSTSLLHGDSFLKDIYASTTWLITSLLQSDSLLMDIYASTS